MRPIDADALIETCENPFVDFIDMDDVRNAPTIDVVPATEKDVTEWLYKRGMIVISFEFANFIKHNISATMHPVECDAKDCKYNEFGYCAKEKVEEAIKNL